MQHKTMRRKTTLTTTHVVIIKNLLKEGYDCKSLANEFKVSTRTIQDIKNGHTWYDITTERDL